jgi:hypothetical protein
MMGLDHPQNVAIHYEGKESQEKNQPHLNESLLECDAEVAAKQAFNREHEDVAAVEDRDWQEVEQTEI